MEVEKQIQGKQNRGHLLKHLKPFGRSVSALAAPVEACGVPIER